MAGKSLILDQNGDPYTSRQAQRGLTQYVGGPARSGLRNLRSGLGGPNDKAWAGEYIRVLFTNRWVLDTMFRQAWAVRKGMKIPPSDALKNWRTWEDESEQMEETERLFGIKKKMTDWMIGGRLYGTALAFLVLEDAPPDEPLDPMSVSPGELKAIQLFHRFRVSVNEFTSEIRDENYRWPESYQITTRFGQILDVHHTRVLRFDGVQLPTEPDEDWEGWGEPLLSSTLEPIMQETQSAAAVTQLIQEASIPVIMAPELSEGEEADEEAIANLAKQVSLAKSVWSTIFLGTGSHFERENVTFAGLDKVSIHQALRCAAAWDIPVTRFMNQSPAGQNATGESDLRNYDTMLAQVRDEAEAQWHVLSTVLARHAGLPEAPDYTWRSYLEASAKDEAEAAKIKAEAWGILLENHVVDEETVASALSGHPVFGELPDPPEPPEPIEPPQATPPPPGEGEGGEESP